VQFHDLLADRQANTSARIRFSTVQTLEDQEDTLRELRINADAVVMHGEGPLSPARLGLDFDQGLVGTVELDGVTNQVLEKLDKLLLVSQQRRQCRNPDHGVAGLDGTLQIRECVF
jgi:hypothetical protein